MSKKKLFVFLMIVLLVPAFIAACGTTDDETQEPEATDAPAPTDVPEPTEVPPPAVDPSGQTITFWHAMSSDANLEGLTAVVDEFNATNEWGITVDAFSQGRQSELETAFNGAITTGELPNLAQGFANGLVKWNLLGVIIPINDFITDPNYGVDAEIYAGIFPGALNAGALPDGSQLGIPMNQSAGVLWYNYTWAEELGFAAPPATPAEFKEQACAAAAANNADDDADNDGTGGYVYFPDASYATPWVWAYGGEIVNEAGDAYTLNNQATLDAALLMKDLSDNGCLLSTPSFPNVEFATRLALFYSGSTAGIPFQYADSEASGSTDVWGAIPFPGVDGSKYVNLFGQLVGIVGTTPEQDLASWLFLRYLTSPETQATWIEFTGYFPTQLGTDVSAKADDVVWTDAWGLLDFGKSEPNLAAHGSVRGAIRDAFFAVVEAEDEAAVQAILDELNDLAAELMAELQ